MVSLFLSPFMLYCSWARVMAWSLRVCMKWEINFAKEKKRSLQNIIFFGFYHQRALGNENIGEVEVITLTYSLSLPKHGTQQRYKRWKNHNCVLPFSLNTTFCQPKSTANCKNSSTHLKNWVLDVPKKGTEPSIWSTWPFDLRGQK